MKRNRRPLLRRLGPGLRVLCCCLGLLGACRPEPSGSIQPGATLSELPPSYALVVGEVRVTADGELLDCPPGTSACGLVLRHENGSSALIPVQTSPGTWPLGRRRSPPFVIRLPAGLYTVERFETGDPGLQQIGRGKVRVDKKFRVDTGALVYIGSLEIDVPRDRRRRPDVRVANRPAAVRRVAEQLAPGQEEMATRLLH